MKLESYWLDTAPPFGAAAPGPVEGRVDVAVVGGGFTGLSAALALARKGASVVVLEGGRVVGEASGRNGGHCNNGLAHDFGGTVASLGAERALALYRAYDAAVDTVEALVAAEGIACDFRRAGKIKLAAKPGHFAKLERSHAALVREADPEARLLGPGELAAEIGSDAFHGAIIHPRSALLHVGRFGVGLAEVAARNGARIHENALVTAIDRLPGGGRRLRTAIGSVEAGQVLLATGTSIRGPLFHFRRRIIPVGSFLIATEPLGCARIDAIMPTRRTATTTRIIGNYFRVSPDERLIFGGRARFAMSSPTSDARSGQVLERAMLDIFPQLAGTRIDYCWGGLVDMTADRFPRAGEHDGLFYSMGYSGHGVQMSVHMGQVMAEVMGGNPAANPWRAFAWPAIRGHFGPPWFLPFVGAWYRLQDRLH
ncbi:glycine/D-amino acid oxidase-like deaminating enzyme [Stella humosa]|uniref:Glycine/D-amino acid oxidase-like deaminating enzyme n=1 Tax=Stella humosa TaxID=94 RepID=A0A3N1KUC9_9PROT|nr:FAD-binding oxidoreductase [Stella humosa]ROP83594.1 glycine/D-amino acid oxidase-like deaminating enzyme [Stella humosa]BBK33134.1 FAD-dependent oxidoreductase [Stella humosa]